MAARCRCAQMLDDARLNSPGVLEGVGQHRKPVGVQRAFREDAGVVGSLGEADDRGAQAGAVGPDDAVWVAKNVPEEAALCLLLGDFLPRRFRRRLGSVKGAYRPTSSVKGGHERLVGQVILKSLNVLVLRVV